MEKGRKDMKITKFHQSCLLIETKGKRILIDPGVIGNTKQMVEEYWKDIDTILVTHRHGDHCYVEGINEILKRDQAELYTTEEVKNHCSFDKIHVVKEGDKIPLSDTIYVEVVHAVHGFLTPMKYNGDEIIENVGYIIDDGEIRLYVTSDTINFHHDYQCNVLCMPFNGNGLTLGISDGISFAGDISPDLVIPIHMEHPKPNFNPDKRVLEKALKEANLEYEFLSVGEFLEIE